MYDQILFPTDGSDGADAVLDHVLDIAAAHDATVHILNVADTTQDSVTQIGGEVVDVLERQGEDIVAEAADRAKQRRVSTVTEVLQGGVPETIAGYATEFEIDLIAMPTHGRTGLKRMLLGSITERVVRQAPVPVLTLRPDEDRQYPYDNVLVPTDGSECADAALETGIDVAIGSGATLHVLSVVDVTSLGIDIRSDTQVDVLEEQAREVVDEATALADSAAVESVVGAVEHGTAIHGEIRSYCEDHEIDLIVIGTHGSGGVGKALLGSVTEKLVRTSTVPVLVVPEPADGE
jgi:nucleotide-binding universal stress UspA family protein